MTNAQHMTNTVLTRLSSMKYYKIYHILTFLSVIPAIIAALEVTASISIADVVAAEVVRFSV